ncbi:adenylosuccinate lyase, partial [Clostridioides difficile]|nr:adenylosuccinate lyase [Clostridioides difficile]
MDTAIFISIYKYTPKNNFIEAVKRGGDRQELHEIIREYSMKAAYRVKHEGKDNNLIELIMN